MNILHFDYDDLNNPFGGGGQANSTWEIYKRLTFRNNIEVVTGNYPGAKNININGIKYRRLGIGNLGSAVSLLTYWLLLPIYIISKQNKFDLIVEYFTAPIGPSLAPWVGKKPLIGYPTFFYAKELSQKYKLPFDFVEKLLIGKYRNFIALTDNTSKKISHMNKTAKIVVIPRGVNHVFNLPRFRKFALFLGRIDIYEKGLDLLISSWENISKKKLKLIIAGNGKEKEEIELKRLIKSKKLSSLVEHIGRVSITIRNRLINDCLFVIYPSRFETFGNVALETLAMGKPLICFDIDGLKWIPDFYCLKIKSINAKSLTQGVLNLLGNIKERKHLALKAKKFSQKFNWDTIAFKHEDFYGQLANN